MFPNAPYIITDFIHIWRMPRFAWWYDVGLILTFATTTTIPQPVRDRK